VSDKLPPKILVIEAEDPLNANICNTIERHWFDVIRTNNAEQALNAVMSSVPNAAVISSRIKDVSAVEMAVRLRKIPKLMKLPVIFLIDEGESPNNYNHIDSSLVELVSRPFTPNQLITAIRSVLRRAQPIFQDKIIKYKDVSMDLATYKVYRSGKLIHLGPTEFKILQLFMQSPKVIFSREHIIQHIWGLDKTIEHRTVDVHVNRLRTLMKLEKGIKDDFIKTVRSSGYCLNLPGEVD
jgi:two-component system phosphate regulon response regulator PhoB